MTSTSLRSLGRSWASRVTTLLSSQSSPAETSPLTSSRLSTAAPFFMFPLRDQHVDINGEVTLRCYAGGVPRPVYSWFKNTQPLTSEPGDVEITANVVIIKRADPLRHNGMYACQVTNLYGTRVSTAQIRVLGEPRLVLAVTRISLKGNNYFSNKVFR